MTGGGPLRPVDDLLDAGAGGLTFFTEFLPRAHRIGAAATVTAAHLRDRYDTQRGLDLTRLTADADVVSGTAEVVGAGVDEQRAWLAGVPTVWESGAACSASDPLGAHVERAQRLHEAVADLARTLAGSAAAIGAIVDEKSRAAVAFADPEIGGLGPAEVDAVLAGASGDGAGPTTQQLARWNADLGTDPDPTAVAQWCTRWLTEVFAPGVEAAVDVFAGLCDDTDRAIGEVFDELARAFDCLDEQRFPGIGADPPPGGRTSDAGAATPAWGTSGGASPADVVRAGVSVVEAGLELAAAVGELTGAVVELATAAVHGTSEVVDGITAALGERPGAEAAEPQSGASADSDSDPDPAPNPDPEKTTGTATPTLPPAASETLPPDSTTGDHPHPAPGAVVPDPGGVVVPDPGGAVMPDPGGAAVPVPTPARGRAGSGPDRTDPAARGPGIPDEPVLDGGAIDGGVILPEAGPL